jgi:hypothetical protein
MIVEEINEFEIHDDIQSIREIDNEKEELVFSDGATLP